MTKIELYYTCPICRRGHSVYAPTEGISKWVLGVRIQDALPQLSATEREQMISHICPNCQKSIFGEE